MNDEKEMLDYVAREMGFQNTRRYIARAEFIFKNISLAGKRVLDIGCGRGAFALWAAIRGAEYVLGLEPESAGSTNGSLSRFRQVIKKFNLGTRVIAESKLLQDIQAAAPFDIAVMFNVINHFDEEAVMRLNCDSAAVEKYISVLSHLRNLMIKGGSVIVADCARSNFWNSLGLKSPVIPQIEWHKHQNPSVWIPIFKSAGFALDNFRWSSLYPFQRLSSNRIIAYLTTSHFVLRFRAI